MEVHVPLGERDGTPGGTWDFSKYFKLVSIEKIFYKYLFNAYSIKYKWKFINLILYILS